MRYRNQDHMTSRSVVLTTLLIPFQSHNVRLHLGTRHLAWRKLAVLSVWLIRGRAGRKARHRLPPTPHAA